MIDQEKENQSVFLKDAYKYNIRADSLYIENSHWLYIHSPEKHHAEEK